MNEQRPRTSKFNGSKGRKPSTKAKSYKSKHSANSERESFSSERGTFKPRSNRDSKFSDRGPKRESFSSERGTFKPRSNRDSKFSDRGPKRDKESFNKQAKPQKQFVESNSKHRFSKPRSNRFNKSDAAPSERFQTDETEFKPRVTQKSFEQKTSGTQNAKPRFKKPYKTKFNTDSYSEKPRARGNALNDPQPKTYNTGKSYASKRESVKQNKQAEKPDGPIRLNKYLSNAGIASRREADQLIQSGAVKVNGQVIDQLGYKINPGDQVVFNNQNIMHERKVYLLLNKPKDCITTSDDPRGRKTVMDYIQGACKERVYPVGRLDRNTTGVLLFTNDGDLTTRLTHPKHGIRKIYHVTLNRNLKPEDFKLLVDGVELEDGPMKADDISFDGTSRREVGIELHSGRNRIVRRMFEHLGYEVVKLDRVMFAGLTKKDLSRGHYRLLNSKEVAFLKMLS